MEDVLVKILIGLFGFLVGLTGAMLYLHRQVTENKEQTAVQKEKIGSAHTRLDEHGVRFQAMETETEKRFETMAQTHNETMKFLTKIVDQNNFLIQKLMAKGG